MSFPQVMSNNSCFPTKIIICNTLVSGQYFVFFAELYCSLLGFIAFIASLLCPECKQGIKFKAEAIKRCKENKITAPLNEWRNIPLFLTLKAGWKIPVKLIILRFFISRRGCSSSKSSGVAKCQMRRSINT